MKNNDDITNEFTKFGIEDTEVSQLTHKPFPASEDAPPELNPEEKEIRYKTGKSLSTKDIFQEFSLSTILTLTTGFVLDRNLSPAFDLVNHVLGEKPHTIPPASFEFAARGVVKFLLNYFEHEKNILLPSEKDSEVRHLNANNCDEWLAAQIEKFGSATFEIPQMRAFPEFKADALPQKSVQRTKVD